MGNTKSDLKREMQEKGYVLVILLCRVLCLSFELFPCHCHIVRE